MEQAYQASSAIGKAYESMGCSFIERAFADVMDANSSPLVTDDPYEGARAGWVLRDQVIAEAQTGSNDREKHPAQR
jgi:hypothetical protein